MTPIAGKPAIYWTLCALNDIAIRRVSIVVATRGNTLEQFVRILFGARLELRFSAPEQPLGVGDSVCLGAMQFEGSPPILVVLGDTIFQGREPIDPGSPSFVRVAAVDEQDRWCMAELDQTHVLGLEDKPAIRHCGRQALTGVYYFADGISTFREIVVSRREKGEVVEMSDLLRPLIGGRRLEWRPEENWLDVGNPDHVHQAHTTLIQSRSFNRLSVDSKRGTIRKTSTYASKFYDEINYLLLLPEELKVYFPRVVHHSIQPGLLSIEMEFYAYPTLSDLFLFHDLPPDLWRRLFRVLFSISSDFFEKDYGADSTSAMEIYVEKNRQRMEQMLSAVPAGLEAIAFDDRLRINGKPVLPLCRAMDRSLELLRAIGASARLSPIHGDLCFSNILCEPARGLIKFIDPRGSFGRQGVLGDFRYDVAKLYHSVSGLYDYIVNDLVAVQVDGSDARIEFPTNGHTSRIQACFGEVFFDRFSRNEIEIITAWLFLSMLPLHADSARRQQALALRGLQLLTTALQ
jgi:dTDP-glucose pyrophosphorylase